MVNHMVMVVGQLSRLHLVAMMEFLRVPPLQLDHCYGTIPYGHMLLSTQYILIILHPPSVIIHHL
jgi:hypothetical protein